MIRKQIIAGLAGLGWFVLCFSPATAQLAKRAETIGLDSSFVPANLNALANDKGDLNVGDKAVIAGSVPFDLPANGENHNLFLKNAGWPEWKQDPFKFFADYDETPDVPTDAKPVVQIPVDDYTAAYVLASCEPGQEYSNILTLRIGVKRGKVQTTYFDYQFEVPRSDQKTGPNVLKTYRLGENTVFLLRLPLNGAWAQLFRNVRCLDVEITKQLRLAIASPDAARFQYRPLGLPSGVHLYGLTFERSPVHFELDGTEGGNVFNEPEIPTFWLKLNQPWGTSVKAPALRATATDYYGKTTAFPPLTNLHLPNSRVKLELPVTKRGYYALTVTLEDGSRVLLRRSTHFALLPKDTRQYRDRSPFGTWDSGGAHYSSSDPDFTGPLYVKAGLRYGMFRDSMEERKPYGILLGNDPKVRGAGIANLDKQIEEIKATRETPTRWMLFHEDALSANHATRTPDMFTGRDYKLNEAERKKYESMLEIVKGTVPRVRAAFPDIKFTLGNGNPLMMEEFLKQKISPDLFDALGNEAATFQRLPESQPMDWVANNPSLWVDRQMLDHYGYKDKAVEACHETMYPGSTPGNLTLHDQANYLVRNVMHSLAWRIPTIRFEGIMEAGNSYAASNWGGAGLMFAMPDVSPKPIYVAVATMTSELDGAKFTRVLPTGTDTLYAFEFSKTGGGFVTCLWTPKEARSVQLRSGQPELTVIDLMANGITLKPAKGPFELTVSPAPVFIRSKAPLTIAGSTPVAATASADKTTIVADLSAATAWRVLEGEDKELSTYNFLQPRVPGRFAVQPVASFEGQESVLRVMPEASTRASSRGPAGTDEWYFQDYFKLMLKQPKVVDGEPTHIGITANGNGGWGRIIFELEDAAGQHWISLGAEQHGAPSPWLADWLGADEFSKVQDNKEARAGICSWNSNDAWGRSYINWSGWGRIQFPLPGNYPGEGYHWPYTSQWRCSRSDGTPGDYIVHYPLKITGIAVTSGTKILYGPEVHPVRRPEIYLKDLTVTYGNPDTAFWTPDPGQR